MGRKKTKATLTSERYSIHTIEVKNEVTLTAWEQTVKRLFKRAHKSKQPTMYEIEKGVFFCKEAAEEGVRAYLTKYSRNGDVHPSIKLVINPRKLRNPDSSYLGILPSDSSSMERLYERFTEVMRTMGLPEFFEDWKLNRVDLCVNLLCPKSKIARELIRTARKWPTPKRYQRLYSDNKHLIKFHTDSVDIVLYDKCYQIESEGLKIEKEQLPNGVLRIEVQYGREYIRRTAKKFGTKGDSWETLKALADNSKPLMRKHINRCFPAGDFCKVDILLRRIAASDFSIKEQRMMEEVVGALRKRPAVDHAIRVVAARHGLGDKEEKQLLEKFDELGISPIPLRQGFFRDYLLSIPKILQEIEGDGSSIVVVESEDCNF